MDQPNLVLVIEDDRIIRKALASVLELIRLQFHMCESVDDARQMIPVLESRIGAVFSDFSLGDGKGTQVLVACRQNGWLIGVPWIFHSGEPSLVMPRLAKDLAAAGLPDESCLVLPKPSGIDIIEAALVEAMRR